MEVLALGEMQMTETELWHITPRSLFNKLEGYRMSQRDDWERMRLQTFILTKIHLDDKNTLTAQELLPFHWDTEELKKSYRPDPKALAEERAKQWAKIDALKNKQK